MTSRHKRLEQPKHFQLTTRDIDVLNSVYQHRFLTSAHIHTLHFAPSSLRVAQVRLKYMWGAGLLDRLYLPPEMPAVRDRYTEQPLYNLSGRGAMHLSDKIGIPISEIPHTPRQNWHGFTRLRHNLVFTDMAVAFQAFVKWHPDWNAETTREEKMAPLVPQWHDRKGAILPDGAITLKHIGFAMPQTLLFEVVRAGARSGNKTIGRKMRRYCAALKSGFFREIYGFDWVRNVIFLTPTIARAKNLAALARDIPGGERLFRFGAYETRDNNLVAPKTLLTADRLTEPELLTPSGGCVSFIPTFSNTSKPSHV